MSDRNNRESQSIGKDGPSLGNTSRKEVPPAPAAAEAMKVAAPKEPSVSDPLPSFHQANRKKHGLHRTPKEFETKIEAAKFTPSKSHKPGAVSVAATPSAATHSVEDITPTTTQSSNATNHFPQAKMRKSGLHRNPEEFGEKIQAARVKPLDSAKPGAVSVAGLPSFSNNDPHTTSDGEVAHSINGAQPINTKKHGLHRNPRDFETKVDAASGFIPSYSTKPGVVNVAATPSLLSDHFAHMTPPTQASLHGSTSTGNASSVAVSTNVKRSLHHNSGGVKTTTDTARAFPTNSQQTSKDRNSTVTGSIVTSRGLRKKQAVTTHAESNESEENTATISVIEDLDPGASKNRRNPLMVPKTVTNDLHMGLVEAMPVIEDSARPILPHAQQVHNDDLEAEREAQSEKEAKEKECNGRYQHLALSRLQLANLTPAVPPEIALLTDLSILGLPLNNLSGTMDAILPSELLTVGNLTMINIHSNDLTGQLPSEFGLLTSLTYLQVGRNKFGGQVPTDVGRLTGIQKLSMYINDFTGSLPSELGQLTSIQELRMYTNAFTGSLPSELGQLTNSQVLRMYSNAFTGSLPSELGQLTNMTVFSCHRNSLNGTLPTDLGRLTSIQELRMYSNAFTGSLPSELGQLTNIQVLRMYSNAFTGSLPSELGQLTNIQVLRMYTNAFTGSLPSELGQLTNIQVLRMYSNAFTGSLPSELGQLTNMTVFSCYRNSLNGTLPTDLGRLTSIQELRMYSNAFTGSLPSELGQLTNMADFSCRRNSLNGSIPSELGQLSNIAKLNLRDNSLSGYLPTEAGLLTKLTELSLRSNSLFGSLPTQIGLLTQLTALSLRSNSLAEPLPSELGLLSQLSDLWAYDCFFSGAIPSEIGLMESLRILNLRNNSFVGLIISELGQLGNLQELDLSLSPPSLRGQFPFDSLPGSLGYLNISGSPGLVGSIPEKLCFLQNSSCSFGEDDDQCYIDFDCSNLLCGCDCEC
ncbi:leucine rich repeat [Seminavis robusta]|uniref:non-specific serine/threonine protein kinase n=1 Tax=Seminavis robusta TaxID=568900 RepID=A0A9N8DK15_9STRA|nr:leucine rich repeat [Seminavis robusta]|eukprot:Sro186_g080600.1 leucine rich repeat (979) ;mRNA; r:18370-21807